MISKFHVYNFYTLSTLRLFQSSLFNLTEDYVWDHYQKSVPMSTYLVAMAVSKFKHVVAEPAENNVTFRIWARNSAFDQLSYAAEVGPKILQFFESYFNVSFPLPKQVTLFLLNLLKNLHF